jgi:hypothetical protein
MTSDAALSNAMLENAGYLRRETGEWTIFDCTVRLGDTEQEDFWVIEIRSPLGTIDAVISVKSITVEEILVERGAPPVRR